MTTTNKVLRIEKSFKFDGYCFVVTSPVKSFKRKVYTRRTGKFKGRSLTFFDSNLYSFLWNGELAVDIRIEAQNKSIKEIEDELGAEEDEVVAPLAVLVPNGEVKHIQYSKIFLCVENRIPVYLVGPAGSGKNHVLEQIAWELNLDFYFTNSIQQEYKLTGFIDAGGKYHETEFFRAFSKGGLFFLDEMDASIPEVLVLLNAAIANGYFEFPTGIVKAHENFRVVSAGNTVGNGADEQYTGRLVLDQATLDRFAIIYFDYDLNIEMKLANGNSELVSFIRDLRVQSKEKGVRSTFSYRCITMVTKLEGKLELEDILVMAIFKGMDKDTINTFRSQGSNKYHNALRRVQA